MTSYTFTIPGRPFAKQRPRSTRKGRMYTPAETVAFERLVAVIARQLIAEPLVGPVKLTIWATFKPPASWSAKKTAATLHRYHTQKPDLDNCVKAIKDGLNRIAYADDCQVAAYGETRKVWGLIEQTVVTVEEI